MAFHIEIDESGVLDYLGDPQRGLSVEDIDKLLNFLESPSGIAAFRDDPSYRCAPGSSNFEARYVFLDSAGRIRQFCFIVNDASAAYGVLRVVYADEG
jgi:hypothetical protein